MLLQRPGHEASKSLFSSCCCVFGLVRVWPHCLPYSPPSESAQCHCSAYQESKGNLYVFSLIPARSVLKEQEDRQAPVQLPETLSCHFFHQACLKTSPLPPSTSAHLLRRFLFQGSFTSLWYSSLAILERNKNGVFSNVERNYSCFHAIKGSLVG